MDALLLLSAQVTASKRASGLLELGSSLSRCLVTLLTEVISVLSAEVASLVTIRVAGDNGSKALGCGMDGSVDEGQLGNVVLVDHPQDGLLFAHVHLRVSNLLLGSSLEFSEAIIGD